MSSSSAIETRLSSVEAALVDADADLSIDLGGNHEVTRARLWRNQVLVDWEPDTQAGGCLLRPDLLRRLIALNARVDAVADGFSVTAAGRVVAGLSAEHADLVARLGGPRRVELQARLRFEGQVYRGGHETYYLVERGQRLALLRVSAEVAPRQVREGSGRTLPAPK